MLTSFGLMVIDFRVFGVLRGSQAFATMRAIRGPVVSDNAMG
jgi:hypothetical protein